MELERNLGGEFQVFIQNWRYRTVVVFSWIRESDFFSMQRGINKIAFHWTKFQKNWEIFTRNNSKISATKVYFSIFSKFLKKVKIAWWKWGFFDWMNWKYDSRIRTILAAHVKMQSFWRYLKFMKKSDFRGRGERAPERLGFAKMD